MFTRVFIHNKFLILLLLLMTYFIGKAFVADSRSEYLITLFFIILIAYSLYIIGHSKRLIFIAGFISGLSVLIVMFTGDYFHIEEKTASAQVLLGIVFFFLVTLRSLQYTLQGGRITSNNLCGAICTYLLLGLAFSYVYAFVGLFDSQAFIDAATANEGYYSGDFVYYSFVTLTTLGYGDIVPGSELARTLSWLEAVCGQIYLTILIAQLVALYIIHNKQSKIL